MPIGTIQYPAIPPDFYQKLGEGDVQGYKSVTKLGFNPAVGTTAELVSGVAGLSSPFMPTVATRVEAVSASANDTAAGTGVRSILITGLDASLNEIQEVITLNGATPVASVQSFLRVYDAISITCGTYRGTNDGNITIRVISGGATILVILAGQSTSLSSHFCVPAGRSLYFHWFFAALEGSKNVSLTFWVAASADVVAAPFVPTLAAGRSGGVGSVFEQNFAGVVGKIGEKTDIWVTGAATSSTAAVTIEYSYILKTD